MIRLEIGLEIRHDRVMRARVTEDKTAVVVVASYHNVSRKLARFKALGGSYVAPPGLRYLALHSVYKPKHPMHIGFCWPFDCNWR